MTLSGGEFCGGELTGYRFEKWQSGETETDFETCRPSGSKTSVKINATAEECYTPSADFRYGKRRRKEITL